VAQYYDHIVQTYGQEKINYIQKTYGIDLEGMQKRGEHLTPEIVYRINIGVGNIESHDIDALYRKVDSMNSALEKADLKNPHDQDLDTFMKRMIPHANLTLAEVRGIYNILKAKHPQPTLDDLRTWLHEDLQLKSRERTRPGPKIGMQRHFSETLPLQTFNA